MPKKTRNPLILFPTPNGKNIARDLCFYDLKEVRTLKGKMYPVGSARELADILLEHNLLCYVNDILALPIEEFLEFTEVNANKRADAVSIRLKYKGGFTRWILSCKAWGYKQVTTSFLETLKKTQQYMGVGTVGSPGSLGRRKLTSTWQEQFGESWKQHRHERPNASACLEIMHKGTGGRSDLISDVRDLPMAWEVDLKNAYGAALAQALPTGKCRRFFYGLTQAFKIWVGEVIVTIKEKLIYGLFPVKQERDGEQITTYPTEPGVYPAWLWSNQTALCERHGLQVEVKDGWGWYETTNDCAEFVKQMEKLRDNAPPEVASMFKLCLVACIGSLGMSSEFYTLSLHGEDGKDQRVCFQNAVTEYFLKTKKDFRPKTMPHWMWYILAQVQTWLTEEALKWMTQELLLATNTDAVILKPEAEKLLDTYVSKLQTEPFMSPRSGVWRKRPLYTVTLPALRHLIATTQEGQQIDNRPGTPHSKRN